MNEYEKPGFYNADCMDAMRQFPDGFFDLAIVDPPYGDGGQNIGGGRRFGGIFDRYKMEQVRAVVRPVQVPKFVGGGYHGKWPDAAEPGELGRQNSAKKS